MFSDWYDKIFLYATLSLLGIKQLGDLAYEQLRWPKWLVRHYDQRKQEEIVRVLDKLGLVEERRRELKAIETQRLLASLADEPDPRTRCLRLLKRAFRTGSFLVGQGFGERFPYFIDVAAEALDRTYANACASVLTSHLHHVGSKPFDFVVGIKEGTPSLALAVADRLELPICLFRGTSEPKFFASSDQERNPLFDGAIEPGQIALVVDDSTTGGRKVTECVSAIRQARGNVNTCLVLFEPLGKDARGKLQRQGVELEAVVQMDAETIRTLERI